MKITISPVGINQDLNAGELDASVWNDGQNIAFRNGQTISFPGWDQVTGTLLGSPQWLLPVYTETEFYWIYAGNNLAGTAGFVGVTDGVNHWDITPTAGLQVSAPGEWTGGVLNGVPFLNNGRNAPIYWNTQTSSPCVDIPGWPANTTCKAIRPFKYHLIAMNITDSTGYYGDLVLWSNAANPGNIPDQWTPAPDNDAGNFTISATTGEIIDGGQLRDQFVVYKQHSTSIMQYVAGQFVFSNRKAFVTTGILARNCWQEYAGSHYVITDGDFIRHDGQQWQSLIEGKMKSFLFDQIDAAQYTQTFLAASHAEMSLLLCYAEQGSTTINKGLVYDIGTDSFGLVNLPNICFMERGIISDASGQTWDTRTGSWNSQADRWNQQRFNPTSDSLVMADCTNNRLYLIGSSFTDQDDNPIPVYLRLESKDMGEPQRDKQTNRIWVKAEGVAQNSYVDVRVGTQEAQNGPIAWTPAYRIQEPEQFAPIIASGRFISLEISGQQRGPWRLNSVDIDYELAGLW